MPDDDDNAARIWIQDFLFGSALYAEYELPGDSGYRLLVSKLIVDGHCPYCQQSATFQRNKSAIEPMDITRILERCDAIYVTIDCTRVSEHRIIFILRFNKRRVQKIGQYPSLADIVNDESGQYRKVLSSDDASELHRAIGLAAHGVGIGAFVYLRRIFERLITSRFSEYKDVEEWSDDGFVHVRIDEKIEFLKDHLPDFILKNRKTYSVLSLEIHELNESECLESFEFLKLSTFFMLDDDRRKKEELDSRKKVEEAIAVIASSKNAIKPQDS